MSTATWTFDPLRCLAPSSPARAPLSGVDCRVRLSRIAVVGSGAADPEAQQDAQVVGHHPPLHAGADNEARPVEDLPQVMPALRDVLVHQRQGGGHERPLLVGNVTGVRFAGEGVGIHPAMLAHPQVHNRL